ncbi:HD domain-containing phosphohydrolase [Telmatospirillum sp.]|uniref:HD domain-containing phosphohydrolase n=1 Tax=Telmatospirillum sp. TaxID=2079197 RepID=UPI002850A892|nr:HD domain-containing phosphohydrolase [Telmatospirillum sp.]MDR3438049.1 response regulator [Telmatospirillum sp.]
MVASPPRDDEIRPGLNAMTVVIVDDSQSSVSLMSGLVLELQGVTAVSFVSSLEALAWLEVHSADLVIVDYVMPEPDGLAFIEILRGNPAKKTIPIIMVTSSDLRDVRYMALQLGATDFLTKPVDPVEFIARVGNTLEAYRAHKALADQSAWLASEVARATATLVEREREALLFLARTAEHRDTQTGRHLARMSTYSWLIAGALGLSAAQSDMIRAASPLHDVGKVAIPDHILLKPGKLSAEEYEIMKSHARHGAEILSGSNSPLLQLACDIALTHHERFDGSGYPHGLTGNDIPLAGRIVAVADVFDALTTARPYKPAWSFDDAYRHLCDGEGAHFAPDCMAAFGAALESVREIYNDNMD